MQARGLDGILHKCAPRVHLPRGRGLQRKRTVKIVFGVVLILIIVWVADAGLAVRRMQSAKFEALEPSNFTILGFDAQIAEEKKWRVIVQNEVPAIYEAREEDFRAPDNPDTRGDAERKRIEANDVLRAMPTVLTEAHIASGRTKLKGRDALRGEYYALSLRLTEEGRSRLWTYCRNRVGQQMLLYVGDQAWSAPVITNEIASQLWLISRFSPFESSDLEIGPFFDEEIPEELLKAALKKP